MENLKPPPNSSPEEIQAWNHMMDTMVSFIKASTNLMNTITLKVKNASAASGCAAMQPTSPKSGPSPPSQPAALISAQIMESMGKSGCEPECLICLPPKMAPCGVCVLEQVPVQQKQPRAQETPQPPGSGKEGAGVEDSVQPPPSVQEPPVEAPPSSLIFPPTPPTSEQPLPLDSTEPAVEETSNLPPEELIAIEQSSPDVAEPTPEASIPAVTEVPSVSEPAPEPSTPAVPAEQPSISVIPLGEPVTEPSKAAGDVECVCESIRAKRMQSKSARGECCCGGSGKFTQKETVQEDESPLPPEILCGCGPSDKQREAMEREMVEKLEIAQKEIMHLQEEMARLQRMNPNKKTGPHATPNTAQLYNEIMRGSPQTYQGTCPTIREPGNKNLNNVRKELFQSPGWSAYDNTVRGVESSASYQSPQYNRGRGMPSRAGYQSSSAIRQPTITSCPSSGFPVQQTGGFQSLAGGTMFSPELSRESPQTGGRSFQSLPSGCPPTCESAQSGGRGFQSLPGGTQFSPNFEYSQSPYNASSRAPQDSSQAFTRSMSAGLNATAATSPQGRAIAAQYYQQPQAQYRQSPPQRLGQQSASAMSGYGSQECSGREAYWSRLAEYGSPAPPMQNQVEPQRQVIICMPPDDRKR